MHTEKIRNLGIASVVPPNVGKEAVDMFIAMDAMYRCTCQDVKEVHIVSSDGDTLEILLNLSSYFKKTNFYWLHPHSNVPTSKIAMKSAKNLPQNVLCIGVR